ncbi:MAG: hypothetical protein HYS56_01460 [Candidatus Omnitrophica bacterium]|nr:hypothetical protein [Candidatus Omnitrophota bacterium]
MLILVVSLLLLTGPQGQSPRHDALSPSSSIPPKEEKEKKPFKIAVAPTAKNSASMGTLLPEFAGDFPPSGAVPVRFPRPPAHSMTSDELRQLTNKITEQIDGLLRSSDLITDQNVFIILEEVRRFPGNNPMNLFILELIRVHNTQKRTAIASDSSRGFRILRAGPRQTTQQTALSSSESGKIAQWILLLEGVTEILRVDYRVSENNLEALKAAAEKIKLKVRRQTEEAL